MRSFLRKSPFLLRSCLVFAPLVTVSFSKAQSKADKLEQNKFYYLALSERLADVSKGSQVSGKVLSSIGESALILERFESLGNIVSRLRAKVPLERWPVSLRVAAAAAAFQRGNYAEARSILPETASLNSVRGDQARQKAFLFASAIYYASGDSSAALSTARAAVGRVKGFDPGLARLQRARILYDLRKYNEVDEEVTKIPKVSPSWFASLRLGAWAAYRNGDYNYVLGNLKSVHGPYLAGRFSPDTYLLEAATLFQLCYYDAASQSLKALKERYEGLATSVQKFRRQYSRSTSMLTLISDYVRGGAVPSSDYPKNHLDLIVNGILASEVVSAADRNLRQIQREEEGIRSSATAAYRAELKNAKQEVQVRALRAAETRLSQMESEISETMEGALAVEVEINTRIRERLLRAKTAQKKEVDYEAEARKGYEFWPWENEFWRDEIGGYAFVTTDVCGEGGI